LKKIASGRVWAGSQAKENGLVDVIGGLDVAIDIAAKKAKLKEFQPKYYPVQQDFFTKLTDKNSENTLIRQQLGEDAYEYYKALQKIKNMQGVQARLPFDIVIK
jgi:protease-4